MYDEPIDYYDYYYYNCAICNEEVETTILKTCIICNRKICEKCDKEGFCMDHYNLLTSEGKSKFNELVEDGKNKREKLSKQNFFGMIIFFAIWLPSFIIIPIFLIDAIYDSFGYFIGSLFAIFMILILPFLIFTSLLILNDARKSKLFIGLKEDKKSLFIRYNKGEDLTTPTIQKKCENCGRILKSDSKYCDKCGSKV